MSVNTNYYDPASAKQYFVMVKQGDYNNLWESKGIFIFIRSWVVRERVILMMHGISTWDPPTLLMGYLV